MPWIEIAVIIVVGFLALKFLVKPLFKVIAIAVIGFFVWRLLMNFL